MDTKMIFDLCLVIFNDFYSINQNVRMLLTLLFPIITSYFSNFELDFSFFRKEKEYIIVNNVHISNYIKHYIKNNIDIYHKYSYDEYRKTYYILPNVYYRIKDKGYKFSVMYVETQNNTSYHKILYSGNYEKELMPFLKESTPATLRIRYLECPDSYGKITGSLHSENHKSNVILDDKVVSNLYEDIDTFYSQEEDFKSRNKKYKRCYLFSGLPGTGKTSLIEEIAIKYKKDIVYVKLEGYSFKTLINALSVNNSTIIVIEDLSQEVLLNAAKENKCEESDKKTTVTKGLSTNDLLNLFDGMVSPFHDNLIFITSNDLTGISKAMLRPGRVDYHIEFTYASKEQVKKIFDKYNVKDTKPDKYIGKFTTAEILNKIQLKEIQ